MSSTAINCAFASLVLPVVLVQALRQHCLYQTQLASASVGTISNQLLKLKRFLQKLKLTSSGDLFVPWAFCQKSWQPSLSKLLVPENLRVVYRAAKIFSGKIPPMYTISSETKNLTLNTELEVGAKNLSQPHNHKDMPLSQTDPSRGSDLNFQALASHPLYSHTKLRTKE